MAAASATFHCHPAGFRQAEQTAEAVAEHHSLGVATSAAVRPSEDPAEAAVVVDCLDVADPAADRQREAAIQTAVGRLAVAVQIAEAVPQLAETTQARATAIESPSGSRDNSRSGHRS